MPVAMTQAEFDAKVASGEISLKPPSPKQLFAGIGEEGVTAPVAPDTHKETVAAVAVPTTTGDSIKKPTPAPKAEGWEALYKPKPLAVEPQPAPVKNKAYQRKLDRFLTDARKISDPELNRQAMDILSSGARWQDIGTALSTLRYNDKAKLKAQRVWEKQQTAQKKQEQIKIKAETTRDTKKVSPKIVNRWGGFAAASDYLDTLMDAYDDSEVGVFDAASPVQWAKRQFNIGDVEKRSKRDNAYSGLESALKAAFGFGANYSAKEQGMMQRYIPSQSDGEEGYKKQIVSSLEGIRNEMRNSVRAQEMGKRDSAQFKQILSEIDTKIAKAKAFAGESTEESTVPKRDPASPVAPEGFKSSRAAAREASPSAPKTVQISSMAELDALLGGR